jgi:polysaccharide transporter, PST family
MIRLIRGLSDNRLVQNTAALYGVQFCRKLIPILSVPYLAWVLGPAGWGKLAFVMSSANLLVLLVEFGFNITATREVARNRDSKEERANIVAGVLGVQLVLFLFGIATIGLFAPRIPMLRFSPTLVFAGLFYAVSQCFVPLWFFLGMEWMRSAAVHSPADVWKALALQAIPFSLQSVAGVWLIYREVPFRFPSRTVMRETLAKGWPMFLFRSGVAMYTSANVFVLGLFAPVESVGYYAAAEKINFALLGLITPIQDALFPRLSRLAGQSPAAAARLVSIGASFTALVGIALPIGVFFLAPTLIAIFAGAKFTPSISVLRVLALLIPFTALSASLGMQCLLPLGKDRIVTAVVLGGGLLNICLGLTFAPRFTHIGMAWAAVISEAAVGLTMVWAASKFTNLWPANRFLAGVFGGLALS